MKKFYNSPNTVVVKLKINVSLLESSPLEIKNENATGSGMSRRRSSWDDDDEE